MITGFQLRKLTEYANLDFVCQAIRANPLEKELEQFGILTGEDSERFERYLQAPPNFSNESLELFRQARELASVKDPCRECDDPETCDEICNHRKIFPQSDMAQHDEQIRREEREMVLTTILDSVSCEYQDERDSSECGCPGSRNVERCNGENCRYFKTDLSQILMTIESLRQSSKKDGKS